MWRYDCRGWPLGNDRLQEPGATGSPPLVTTPASRFPSLSTASTGHDHQPDTCPHGPLRSRSPVREVCSRSSAHMSHPVTPGCAKTERKRKWLGACRAALAPRDPGLPSALTARRSAGGTLQLSGLFYVFEEDPSFEAAASCPLVGGERK
jgi:hypothetical protein